MNEITIVKLVTGETIIGWERKDCIENAFNIMMLPTARGEMGMNIVPYMMPFTQDGCNIDNKFIITTMEAPEELKSVYLEATSGIIIPKSKIQM